MATSAIFERLSLHAPHVPKTVQAIPAFLYGTAWKKENTADLVYRAICAGFTGVDTANQPKHYKEDLVGVGIRRALAEGRVKREHLYLQTKFTAVGGQDLNDIPYDPKTSVPEQVRASVELSLKHLRSTEEETQEAVDSSYLDAVVLHSPLPNIDNTMEAWRTLEEYVPSKIRNLGISNCDLFTLMDICERANVKPAVVQNRFYRSAKFDIGLRKFCRENSIIYQSFWTLTANPELVWSAEVGLLANQVGISPQAALYCLVLGLDNTVILNGTKQDQRMRDDLAAPARVKELAEKHPGSWAQMVGNFRKLIGESTS